MFIWKYENLNGLEKVKFSYNISVTYFHSSYKARILHTNGFKETKIFPILRF